MACPLIFFTLSIFRSQSHQSFLFINILSLKKSFPIRWSYIHFPIYCHLYVLSFCLLNFHVYTSTASDFLLGMRQVFKCIYSHRLPTQPALFIVEVILSHTKMATAFVSIHTGICVRAILFHSSMYLSQRQYKTVLITKNLKITISGKAGLLTLFFFFRNVLAILASFLLHINFRISLSSSTKNLLGFLLELH